MNSDLARMKRRYLMGLAGILAVATIFNGLMAARIEHQARDNRTQIAALEQRLATLEQRGTRGR
jgi:hypothetical protein